MAIDKLVLITGSSRGIGAATARLFAEHGYTVCVNYRTDENAANQVLEQIAGKGIAVRADVSVEADVVRLFQTVDKELGVLSVLVNNAGMLLPQLRLQDMDAARVNKILTTNVTSQFLCCREAVKRMSTAQGGNGGAIVNVSSAASRLGSPNEYIDYAASKGAIDTLTMGLSKEVADEGIRVNCVRPGLIDTTMHADGGEPGRIKRLQGSVPMHRAGEAEEVAAAIYWLASTDASYTTGSFVDVSGGR